MVIDSSAIVAILQQEPGWLPMVEAIGRADDPLVSAATMVEASMVMSGRVGPLGVERVDVLLGESGVRCMAVDVAQMNVARHAWLRYGKGRHPAGLNFGDCFSYALATTKDRPLLYKGEDFARTDVRAALAL